MNSWNVANASMRRWQFRDQTLPLSLLGLTDAGLDDIFTAVTLQQTRLHHDQQMPLGSRHADEPSRT